MTPTQIAALAGSGSLTRVCAARTELRLSRAKMRALLERAARNVVCEQRREASAAAALASTGVVYEELQSGRLEKR
jgi:hypothetical protein